MQNFNKEDYLSVARGVSIFNQAELETLEEVLEDYKEYPNLDYFMIEERLQDGALLGFVIFGRTPITQFSWDIFWLMVDKSWQGKGVGKKLLKRTEEFVFKPSKRAILRVETSTKKEYAHARNLYIKQGFKEVGKIPDFYAVGDDLIIYSKDTTELS